MTGNRSDTELADASVLADAAPVDIDLTAADPATEAAAGAPVVASTPTPLDYKSVRSVLKAAAEVAIPAGFLVSLAYYFGLARTRKLYTELGVDESVLEFSTTDYLLRSLSVLIVPIPWFVVAAVAAVVWYLLLRWLFAKQALAVLGFFVVVALGGATWAWFGIDRIHESGRRLDPANTLWMLIIACAAAMVIWAAATSKPHGFSFGDGLPTAAVVALAMAGLLFLAFLAFEAVRARAVDAGAAQAREAEAAPQEFPCVQLTTDLRLTAGDLVVDDRFPDDPGDFHTYEGLRMFVKSGSGYLLFADDQSPRRGLFLVAADHVASIQFHQQRNEAWQPCPRTG